MPTTGGKDNDDKGKGKKPAAREEGGSGSSSSSSSSSPDKKDRGIVGDPGLALFALCSIYYMATLGGESALVTVSPAAFIMNPVQTIRGTPPLDLAVPLQGNLVQGRGGPLVLPFGGFEHNEEQLFILRQSLGRGILPGTGQWDDDLLRSAELAVYAFVHFCNST